MSAREPEMHNRLVIRAAWLFDGTSAKFLPQPTVTIEGQSIVAVEFGGETPVDGEVVDLGDATLLPGLVDTHVHLTLDSTADPVGNLAKRDDEERILASRDRENGQLGIEVTDMDSDIARRFGIDGKENGVLVTDIKEDTPAQEADVRPGDVIKEINRSVVKDRRDFTRLMKKNSSKDAIQLLIKRRNAGYLVVTIERQ